MLYHTHSVLSQGMLVDNKMKANNIEYIFIEFYDTLNEK